MIKVNYISGYEEPDEDGDRTKEIYKSFKIDRMYTKLYASGMIKLSLVNGIPFPLFMFLCESCKVDGVVRSGTIDYQNFIEWMEKATSKKCTYKSDTVRKAFTQLTEVDLLIKLSEGTYRINPVHFWKGSNDRERIDAVRKLLEEKTIEPWLTEGSQKKSRKKSRAKKFSPSGGISGRLEDDEFDI